ncbi:hypothetical protein LPJ56_002710 [Coemansia sp. RSA 2599]|nr:hypothetical protein LPJ75_002424 [Coemansia sp. RSA 2598]KAJ1825370.1 hypothetical protein LPJ56_002710 [Coemansia sp. RSA 2599]
MVAQLENSEQVIVSRNTVASTAQPSEPEKQDVPANAHNETSEFEDDAVMVAGESSAEGQGGSNNSGDKRDEQEQSNSDAADGKKPEEKKAAGASRRWFW